jgi:hypothetical protein
MAGLSDGPMTFKVVGWTDWQQGFEHEDFLEATPAELRGLAGLLGAVLAGTHARGLTVNGDPGVTVLRAELEGRAERLVAEVAATAPTDLAQLLDDHARFRDALANHGPLLGADLPAEDLPR